jgi:transposase
MVGPVFNRDLDGFCNKYAFSNREVSAEDHPNQITTWKAQLLDGAAGVFGSGGSAPEAAPTVDLKTLHAKIGELTLENDFLAGALTKAGMLSAKR